MKATKISRQSRRRQRVNGRNELSATWLTSAPDTWIGSKWPWWLTLSLSYYRALQPLVRNSDLLFVTSSTWLLTSDEFLFGLFSWTSWPFIVQMSVRLCLVLYIICTENVWRQSTATCLCCWTFWTKMHFSTTVCTSKLLFEHFDWH